jgi:hypothetical protein
MAQITVKFDNRLYVRSHFRNPPTTVDGQWAFALASAPDEVIWSPPMTLAKAKAWVTRRVRELELPASTKVVYVNVLP